MQTATPGYSSVENELERLIEEQRKDDRDFQQQERWLDKCGTYPMNKRGSKQGEPGDCDLGDFIGVDEEGNLVSFITRRRGGLFNADTLNAWWHGTVNGYTNHKCRCPRCTEANTLYCRDLYYRKQDRATPSRTTVCCEFCGDSFLQRLHTQRFCDAICLKNSVSQRRKIARRLAVAA